MALPFKRVLIANRGEIAVRIIRACRDLGLSPIAVYSEADRAALHVRLADEAYLIGEAPSSSSYLVIDRILEAAQRSQAEAIHPGYGFLAENARFARRVGEAGLVFIGPSPESIELMGSKTNAREAALRAGAPIVPGTAATLSDEKSARVVAAEVGYPIMLKAAAGGGGKGMRIVRGPDEIASAFSMAQAEAVSSFGDPSLYIERLIERPRHIEIQIAADWHGNVVHLGERECSVQRRHQKVIEECPASFNDAELRERMGIAAVNIARSAGYYSIGTLEFLVDASRDFFFLEMNTRLQVEHPVTEMVTGIDLVCEQIRIAAGEPLSFSQSDVHWNGSAIECRVYAEDPHRGFLPSPGRITRLNSPSGPGVRDDTGVYQGWEVPIHYDPMISKLVAWGATRDEAIARLERALGEYHIGGIRTTIPFFQQVLADDEFRRAEIDTGFIARFLERTAAAAAGSAADPKLAEERLAAAFAAATSFVNKQRAQRPQGGTSSEPSRGRTNRWKTTGPGFDRR
ncbi:MAG: acetyl-CoA carboxylase biotin carboxylase subunit [Acidobacteriota bacterium]